MDNYKLGEENIDDLYDGDELEFEAGLIPVGKDEDGNLEWMGTRKQWDRYSELEQEEDFDTDAGLVGDISDDNREGVIL
jgi:hypothetical protein